MCAKRGFSTTPGDDSAMPGEWSATPGLRSATPGERSATPSDLSTTPGELSVFAAVFRPLTTFIKPLASLARPATSLLAILLVTAQLTGCTAIRLVADLANIYKDEDEAASERVLAPVITPPRARDADREAARDADRDAARDAQRDSARDTARKGAPRAAREEVKASPVYKIGEPYSVNGNWYYPKRDLTYDETGIASWYGEEFAGRLTANGEIFEPGIVSAAHQTLPMPSIVRVTNLENGRSLVVRINDRGPFVRGRIIDLSREAARLLEFSQQGTAKVRVLLLAEPTIRIEKLAKRGLFPNLSTTTKSEAKPEFTGVGIPDITFSADSSTGRSSYTSEPGQSAIDLLANRPRVGDVRDIPAGSTNIWIQVGAFRSENSAGIVLSRIDGLGTGKITSTFRDGETLYRVRIGPVKDVALADNILEGVVDLGFQGARIIVE